MRAYIETIERIEVDIPDKFMPLGRSWGDLTFDRSSELLDELFPIVEDLAGVPFAPDTLEEWDGSKVVCAVYDAETPDALMEW